jgi:hypothetical protein
MLVGTPAQATSNANTQAQQWVAALTPASQQFPQIVAKLKALPATATPAQVQAVIAPVAGLIAPAQQLIAVPGTSSLEAIGPPSNAVDGANASSSGCYSYKTAIQGAVLSMGGAPYTRGLQLTANVSQWNYTCVGTWTWGWHIAGLFKTFTAMVGLGAGDISPATFTILGTNGSPLTFYADGHPVRSTTLMAGLPTKISVNVVGTLNLVVRTTVAGAIINLANDNLIP